MAAGSVTVSITLPVNNQTNPDYSGRQIAVELLRQAAQAIGSSQGGATSGNLTKTFTQAAGPTVIGTWTYVAST